MSITLQQIWDANYGELKQALGKDLFLGWSQQQIQNDIKEVLNIYRKQLIIEYLKYDYLDAYSKEIATNKHFLSSITLQNDTLEKVIQNMNNRSHREDSLKYHPSNYFLSNSNLDENEEKYCRAILHIASKQEPWCLEGKHWNETNPQTGVKCYNPYAIASKVIHRNTRPDCLYNLNLDVLPENELWAEVHLHQMKNIQELKDKQKNT